MAVTSKDLPAKRPPSPEGEARADTRQYSFIEWLTPQWGRTAAREIKGYVGFSTPMTMFCGTLSIVVFLIGVGLLFGDGFATIQGVRYTLRILGLPVQVDTFPPLKWWTIQLVLVFIQVFAKKVRGLGVLWTPAYLFNATTTSVFIAIALGRLLGVSFGITEDLLVGTVTCAAIGSVLGHFLALGAEQVTLTGLCMLSATAGGMART
jgi:hypothetical protein